MTDELIALRAAVDNACRFLGPGSRTGNRLAQAMTAAESAERLAAEARGECGPCSLAGGELVFDKGPWAYRTDPKAATHVGRYFVESDDFKHDVRLYINGDFGNDDDRRRYGEALATTLNRARNAPQSESASMPQS